MLDFVQYMLRLSWLTDAFSLRGQPHQSVKSPSDGTVVSVRLRSEKGNRIATAHIKADGSYNYR